MMLALVISLLVPLAPAQPTPTGCEREFDGEWSDARFAAVAGEGLSKLFRNFEVAQVWRRGPRDASVIARLGLSDPEMSEAGLIVAIRVRNGRSAEITELEGPDCYGLRRGERPDFGVIRHLDENLRGRIVELLRRERGVDPAKVSVRIVRKVIQGDELRIVTEAAYPRDAGPHVHQIHFRLSHAGFKMDDLG